MPSPSDKLVGGGQGIADSDSTIPDASDRRVVVGAETGGMKDPEESRENAEVERQSRLISSAIGTRYRDRARSIARMRRLRRGAFSP